MAARRAAHLPLRRAHLPRRRAHLPRRPAGPGAAPCLASLGGEASAGGRSSESPPLPASLPQSRAPGQEAAEGSPGAVRAAPPEWCLESGGTWAACPVS